MTDSCHCDLPASRAQFGEMGGKGMKLESLMSQGRLLLLPACGWSHMGEKYLLNIYK